MVVVNRARLQGEVHPTGAQIRAARGLLNLSVARLAEETALAPNTIKRAESTEGPAPLKNASLKLLVTTLSSMGVRFVEADGECGVGVRLELLAPVGSEQRRRRRRSGSEEQDTTPTDRLGSSARPPGTR